MRYYFSTLDPKFSETPLQLYDIRVYRVYCETSKRTLDILGKTETKLKLIFAHC